MRDFIELSKIDLNDVTNEFQKAEIVKRLQEEKELKEFWPDLVAGCQKEGEHFYSFFHFVLRKENPRIYCTIDHKGQFDISLDEYYQNVQYGERSEAYNAFWKPNNFKKPSAKRFKEWVDYLTNVWGDIKGKERDNTEKINKFLTKVAGIEGFQFWDGDRSGQITRNGIYYRYTIENGYISEQIRISCTVSLDNFLLISDNKFNKK